MKDIILFENFGKDDFKLETDKIVDVFEKLLKDYEQYALLISPHNWRSSGNIFTNLTQAVDIIKSFNGISDEDILRVFDMGITEKDKKLYQEKYTELYQKYLKSKTKDKFNL